ncbi:MAG TPA: PF20097 family protein [Terricaulis sp.]|nr:PF20097 family protein [Terricaulis sp.]HRP09731.1 PF20097 family protein [Terricaulis sp.]
MAVADAAVIFLRGEAMSNLTCPKCQGGMQKGWVLDSAHGGSRAISTWVEGEPKPSIWLGLKLGGATPIPLESWRCKRCGFLENYAKDVKS